MMTMIFICQTSHWRSSFIKLDMLRRKNVPRNLYAGVKRPGREADQSLLSSAEVKNA
jgi:hypothetical protein